MVQTGKASADTEGTHWTFLTNHGHVLVCIANDPGVRGKDIAVRVGITERAAQAIIADLVNGGYVTRTKIGRRNHYEINSERPLRHPVEQPHSIGELLELVAGIGVERQNQPVSQTFQTTDSSFPANSVNTRGLSVEH